MSVKTETLNVATAITAVQVRQGGEGAFAGWLTELNKTISTFPGYVSAAVIPPVPPSQSDWIMVQRFQKFIGGYSCGGRKSRSREYFPLVKYAFRRQFPPFRTSR